MSAIRIDDDNGVERLAGDAVFPDGLPLPVTGSTLGFFGESGATVQTVSNAAAADIITALAAYGLIIDGT